MNLIVAVDKNWAIGKNKKLMWSIPADKIFFREKTMGQVVIMGRKTLESLPGGLPLDGRTNIVLTSKKAYQKKGVVIVHSLAELQEVLGCLKKENSQEIFVIGGGSVYRMLLPYCDTAYVTKIDHAYEADTWFANLDQMPEWELKEVSEEQTCFDLEYVFSKYENRGVIPLGS